MIYRHNRLNASKLPKSVKRDTKTSRRAINKKPRIVMEAELFLFIVCRADRVSCRGCRSDALFCLCVCRPTWDAEQALPSPRGLL